MRFKREGFCSPWPPSITRANNGMSQTAAVLVHDIYGSIRVCLVFGECCNRDWEGSDMALLVVTITIRSHRGPRCVPQRIAGHSSSTGTPMIGVACPANKDID